MKLKIVNETHLDVNVNVLQKLIAETIAELDEFGIKYGGAKFVLRIYDPYVNGSYSHDDSEIILFLGKFYIMKLHKKIDKLMERCLDNTYEGRETDKIIKRLVKTKRENNRVVRILVAAENCMFYLDGKGKSFDEFLKTKNKKILDRKKRRTYRA